MEHPDGSGGMLAGDDVALAATFGPGSGTVRMAVAVRLRRCAEDVVREVQRITDGHERALMTSADEHTARQRQATQVRRGVHLLAQWLEGGVEPTSDQLAPLVEAGRWVAESLVPFSRVVRVGQASRDALWAMVCDEAHRCGATSTVAYGLRVAVDRGCDTALALVAGAFDERTRTLAAELAAKDREMAHRALHDPLTGLANRILLFDRLHQVAQRARRHPTVARPAVLFVDLDGFKAVNDERGHAAGDALLRLVARRMKGIVRPEDTVARLGGDEFVVLCESIPDRGWSLELAGRVLNAVQAPIADGDRSISIGASIGVAVGDPPGWDPDRLLSEADHAMYRARQLGPGRVHAAWLTGAAPDGRRPAAATE